MNASSTLKQDRYITLNSYSQPTLPYHATGKDWNIKSQMNVCTQRRRFETSNTSNTALPTHVTFFPHRLPKKSPNTFWSSTAPEHHQLSLIQDLICGDPLCFEEQLPYSQLESWGTGYFDKTAFGIWLLSLFFCLY